MWSDEMIMMTRYVINDIDGSTYSDSRLQKALVVSAQYVNSDLFSNKYTITITGSGQITPDPTDPRDNSFINLTVLKTACMIGMGEAKIAGGQGIAIKDGSSSLDLRGVSQYKYESSKSFCQLYEKAKLEFLMNGDVTLGRPGEAVFGPITYWGNYGRQR